MWNLCSDWPTMITLVFVLRDSRHSTDEDSLVTFDPIWPCVPWPPWDPWAPLKITRQTEVSQKYLNGKGKKKTANSSLSVLSVYRVTFTPAVTIYEQHWILHSYLFLCSTLVTYLFYISSLENQAFKFIIFPSVLLQTSLSTRRSDQGVW